MRRRGEKGNAVLELALCFPVLLLLVVGMVQFGKIAYLQHSLRKALYSVARSLSVQQSLNLCDSDALTAMTQNLITDPNTQTPLVEGLTGDMLLVSAVCVDAAGNAQACDTASHCSDPTQPAARPAYLTVSIPAGYPLQLRIPYVQLPATPLYPVVTVPFSGSVL